MMSLVSGRPLLLTLKGVILHQRSTGGLSFVRSFVPMREFENQTTKPQKRKKGGHPIHHFLDLKIDSFSPSLLYSVQRPTAGTPEKSVRLPDLTVFPIPEMQMNNP